MTKKSVSEALSAELMHRRSTAQKAADLLRNAADRLESGDPDETRGEHSARLRGSAILSLTAALELAACSGWIEALASVEGVEVEGGIMDRKEGRS